MKTTKTAGYVFEDCEPLIGVVRCNHGDARGFWAHALEMLDERRYLDDCWSGDGEPAEGWAADLCRRLVKPPEWRWYRKNVIRDSDYAWTLGKPAGPGQGNWRGAVVEVDWDLLVQLRTEAGNTLAGRVAAVQS